jgi:quinol monooxygenase YgiN
MSVVRINQFQAQAGLGEELKELLTSFLPSIKASEGCESCQLLRSNDNPDRMVVLEVWTDIDAHKASVRDIPPKQIETLMKVVAGPPKGGYYLFT